MAIIRKTWDSELKSNQKYPWNEWLDGQIREIEAGKDFLVPSESIRTQAFIAAYKRGARVRTSVLKNGNLLLQRL